MHGSSLAIGVALSVLAAASARAARAQDGPPPPPPTHPTPVPYAPPYPDEQRRTIDRAPANAPVYPPAPAPSYTQPAPYYAQPAPMVVASPAATPCRRCFQPRDECGCPIDSCGNRYGSWDITLEGGVSAMGSPDGILGEQLFVPGHQLAWNDVDYPASFGGRATVSYRFECLSRLELRGTYYGNPDESASDSGVFAARPGAGGLGDVSRPVNARFSSDAEVWGVELNWWTELACENRWRLDAGVGVRYLSLEENARVDFVTTGPGPFPVANGFVLSEVTNHFLGGQLLLAVHNDLSECVEFTGSLKGLFGSIDRSVDVTDQDVFSGGRHHAAADDDEFVFGLDFELGVKWRVARAIQLGLSYNFLFLDNVQRAEDGFDFGVSNSGAVQARQAPDQLAIHSLFAGVTFNL